MREAIAILLTGLLLAGCAATGRSPTATAVTGSEPRPPKGESIQISHADRQSLVDQCKSDEMATLGGPRFCECYVDAYVAVFTTEDRWRIARIKNNTLPSDPRLEQSVSTIFWSCRSG